MDVVKDELNTNIKYTERGGGLPESERNKHTIAERIYAHDHNLHYKAITKVMLIWMDMVSKKQMNLFPVKIRVSKYLSPHVIMSDRNQDFNKHFQIPFGAYVQVSKYNNPINTNSSITLDSIYLQPLDNKQGGHVQ